MDPETHNVTDCESERRGVLTWDNVERRPNGPGSVPSFPQLAYHLGDGNLSPLATNGQPSERAARGVLGFERKLRGTPFCTPCKWSRMLLRDAPQAGNQPEHTVTYTGDLQLLTTGLASPSLRIRKMRSRRCTEHRKSQNGAAMKHSLPRGQTVPDLLSYPLVYTFVGAAPRGQPGWHSSQLHCLSGTRRTTTKEMRIRARSDGGPTEFDKSLLSARLATSAYGAPTKWSIGYPRRRLPSQPGPKGRPHRSWTWLPNPSLSRRRHSPWRVAHLLLCCSRRLRKGKGLSYTNERRLQGSRPNPDNR